MAMRRARSSTIGEVGVCGRRMALEDSEATTGMVDGLKVRCERSLPPTATIAAVAAAIVASRLCLRRGERTGVAGVIVGETGGLPGEGSGVMPGGIVGTAAMVGAGGGMWLVVDLVLTGWPNSSIRPSSDGGGFRVEDRLRLGRPLGVFIP